MRNGKLPITVSANVIADRGAPRSKTVALSEPIADTYLAKVKRLLSTSLIPSRLVPECLQLKSEELTYAFSLSRYS